MNATLLAQSGYATTRATVKTERSIEYEVFARVTQKLRSAMRLGAAGFVSLVHALHENRNLWRVLATDVASSENALPPTIRAQIFYLAEFTDIQTGKILSGEATADSLVDINTNIMRGLRGILVAES